MRKITLASRLLLEFLAAGIVLGSKPEPPIHDHVAIEADGAERDLPLQLSEGALETGSIRLSRSDWTVP